MKSLLFILLLVQLMDPCWAQSSLEKNIEDHFRIHILNEDRRNPGDRVQVKGNRASIYLWRNLDQRNPAMVICDAYTWFLKGRTKFGKGIEQAFSKFSTIDRFEFRLFDISFSTKRGPAKGEFVSDYEPKEYLRLGISRGSAKANYQKEAWVKQQLDNDQCEQLKNAFDEVWFDQAYIRTQSQGVKNP